MKRWSIYLGVIAGFVLPGAAVCVAEVYKGIEFPDGPISFADRVIRYDPLYSGGPAPTRADVQDPYAALGVPDYGTYRHHVTLGRGGLLEVQFVDNFLTNSGNDTKDLHIFEVGSDVEDTFVAIRPNAETADLLGPGLDANGDGFYEIGKVYGSTSSIDIDVLFPGYAAGELVFDAVQLVDDPDEGQTSGATVGADIDAVGAIASKDACEYKLMGDLDGDCVVNFYDFALMARNWLVNCNDAPDNPACIPEEG